MNSLIKENFFIIESTNLNEISSNMYGYTISKKGIITNNYYKRLGKYEEPEPLGVYILIRRNGNIIQINQDYYGSYGLYIYENKEYFAISNSFLLLAEHLRGIKNMTFNKDFADNLIISGLCSPSIYETLIKEINKIPSNSFIIINVIEKNYKINYMDQQRYTIPFESEDGLKIIDKWVDKWGYIFRSLKKKTDNISMDLSGGFDTRAVLSILYNSGIDLKDILIHSINNNVHNHEEDFRIATNISSKLGLKLNYKKLDDKGTIFDINNTLDLTMYTKLGFHKEFYFKNKFFMKPRFTFTGAWGGMLRGYPNKPIQEYINDIISQSRNIWNYKKEFSDSSKRILKRSINRLKYERNYSNDYEVSIDLYLRGRGINHFGKASVESFLANEYRLEPLSDPDIKKLKISNNESSLHNLIAYIYVRFSPVLINVPFEGNRILNKESIKNAENLNNKIFPYKIKSDYNKDFFIDVKRKSPVNPSKYIPKINEYLKEMFQRKDFFLSINPIYNKSVYNWAKKYSEASNYFPLRHFNALLAISKVLGDFSINKRNKRV